MVFAGFIGRLPLSMVGLGCVLLIVDSYPGHSYALGGAVAAGGAVATAILGPIIGRLADAYGQRKVLLPVVTVFALGGVLFVIAVRAQLPVWVVFASAAIAGGCIPPIASMLRARWTYLLEGSRRLPTALAFESVIDEFTFIIGPVLVTFLATSGHATSGVVVAFVLAIVGSLLFSLQRRTEPPPGRTEVKTKSGPSAIRTPGLIVLCFVGLALGIVLGSFEVNLVAFADEKGAKGTSGLLIAGLAAGSMVAGIVWGTVHWLAPLNRRLLIMLGFLTLGTLPLLVMPNVPLMLVFVIICGVAVSPSLITTFTLVEILVPRHATTEGFTWIGTTLALGVAVGTSASGIMIDKFNANLAFAVPAVAAAFAALIVWACQRLLMPRSHKKFGKHPDYAYPESKVAESKVAESKVAESKVAESKAAESKAAESKVGESPVAESPAGEPTVVESPAEAPDQPVVEQPIAAFVAEPTVPAEDKPDPEPPAKPAGPGLNGTHPTKAAESESIGLPPPLDRF